MLSNSYASRSLRHIAEVFFLQVQGFGQFGLEMKSNKEILDDVLVEHFAFVLSYLQLLENAADLTFDRREALLLYNTQSWPTNVPPAGYTAPDFPLKPSQMLESYVAAWHFYWVSKEKNYRAWRRPLKAALWVCQQEGLATALVYIFDLQRSGWILEPQDTYDVLDLLLRAYRIVGQDEDILTFFFGTHVPRTGHDLIHAEFAEFALDSPYQRAISPAILQTLIEEGLRQIERVRHAATYDTWLTGQWLLGLQLEQIMHLLKKNVQTPSVSLQAIIDQFEEMRADSGGIRRILQSQYVDCPLLSIWTTIMGKLAKAVFSSINPTDWKSRLVRERALLPSAIQDILLDDAARPMPAEWHRLSPGLSLIFSQIVLHADGLKARRTKKFTSEAILQSNEALNVFMEWGISDPNTQMILAQHYAGELDEEREKLSWIGIRRELNLPHGSPAEDDGPESDDAAKANLDAIDAWLEENKETVKQIGSELELRAVIEELQTTLVQAAELGDSGRTQVSIQLLESLLELYPWCDFVHSELGIAYDKDGQPEHALPHLEAAITVRPTNADYWHSLAVVLNNLGNREEAMLASAVSEMVKSRKSNSNLDP